MDDISVHRAGHKNQRSDHEKKEQREGDNKERQRYGKLSDDVSRVLRNIVLTLLILVVLSQVILRSDGIRHHLSNAEKLEGMPFQKVSLTLH
ncbi:hypothetical protein DFQ01_104132 [Paenibacillus cellulosilyticus]|uniref:Uncharacterized protein n=1 Tax=Paenibacillus cellulosilyticus TaxID=375489 RepID=A0A2V2YWC3_9BACL|nr:hypothetical protein DFQ01_104132 [Paenibacillus cellulosilyticus]